MLMFFFGLILIISFYTDIFKRRISNLASLGGALLGMGLNTYDFGLAGFRTALLGWLIGVVLFAIPYALGGMGAGDAKLLGTVGAFMGPGFVWQTFLATAILGGLYATGVLLYRKRFFVTAKTSIVGLGMLVLSRFKINTLPELEQSRVTETIPYGAFIGVSVFILLYGRRVLSVVAELT